jgi:hypothetical protein
MPALRTREIAYRDFRPNKSDAEPTNAALNLGNQPGSELVTGFKPKGDSAESRSKP